MKRYFSHAAYNRWYRQYEFNLENFTMRLNDLRRVVVSLPWQGTERAAIEHDIYEIDEKLEGAIPRNFELTGEPLTSSEIFSENMKVIINLFCTVFRIPFFLPSIYYLEKNRVNRNYPRYKFKEKLNNIQEKLDRLMLDHQSSESMDKKRT